MIKLSSNVLRFSLEFYAYMFILGPICSYTVAWMKSQGKSMSSSTAILTIFGICSTAVAVVIALAQPVENHFEILGVNRFDPLHTWAKTYVKHRKQFFNGEISEEKFQAIDRAYDHLYDENLRTIYLTWGPEAHATWKEENPVSDALNLSLYYIIWTAGMVILANSSAKKSYLYGAVTGLVLVFGLEFSVRLMHYDPELQFFPQTTPFEMFRIAQIVYPPFLIFLMAYGDLFYKDPVMHRNQVLHHMRTEAKKNHASLKNMHDIIQELKTKAEPSS